MYNPTKRVWQRTRVYILLYFVKTEFYLIALLHYEQMWIHMNVYLFLYVNVYFSYEKVFLNKKKIKKITLGVFS